MKTISAFPTRMFKGAVVLAALSTLMGCAVTPDTITHEMPEKPNVTRAAPPANGAIFQTSNFRPMYEDRRAMYVGDTIIIVINERTSAAKQGSGSASHTGSASYSPLALFNTIESPTGKLDVSTTTANEYENGAARASSNNFTGTIGATVADVLPNGNLLVKGEKQIALDHGTEFIRISGVVNPKDISNGNTVSSALVADARVEYRSNTRLDASDIMSMVARFFLSISPI
jgi:flagellar L-ring protein precursor FlgH